MISNDPLMGTLEEKVIENPHESQDEWGFLYSPPKNVRVMYTTTVYVAMVTGIILAFPFLVLLSAKKWYDKNRKDQDDE